MTNNYIDFIKTLSLIIPAILGTLATYCPPSSYMEGTIISAEAKEPIACFVKSYQEEDIPSKKYDVRIFNVGYLLSASTTTSGVSSGTLTRNVVS